MKNLTARLRSEEGTSLMELMIGLAITGFALTAIVSFTFRARGSMTRLEGTSDLIAANHRVGNNLRTSLAGNTAVVADYGGSPNFTSVRNIMLASINAVTGTPKPVSFSAQPVVQDANKMSLTAGGPMAAAVGNELFFVSTLPPITFTVSLASGGTVITTATNATYTSSYVVSVDRLQFVALYLAQENKNLKNGQKALRLVEWRSRPFGVYASISYSSGAYLTATCQALIARGYNMVVNTDSITDTAGSYLSISGTGAVTNAGVPSSFGQSSWGYVDEYTLSQALLVTGSGSANRGRIRNMQSGAGIVVPATFSYAHNSVASVAVPTPLASFSTAGRRGGIVQVPAYATIDRGGPGFPGGFEVLVAGRPGAREILLRSVVVMSNFDNTSRARNAFLASDAETYVTCDTRY